MNHEERFQKHEQEIVELRELHKSLVVAQLKANEQQRAS